MTIICKRNKI